MYYFEKKSRENYHRPRYCFCTSFCKRKLSKFPLTSSKKLVIFKLIPNVSSNIVCDSQFLCWIFTAFSSMLLHFGEILALFFSTKTSFFAFYKLLTH